MLDLIFCPLVWFYVIPAEDKRSQQKYIHTIDKLLLSSGDDTTEVGTVLSAVFLCILPGVSVGEVPEGRHRVSVYGNT